MLPRFLSRIPLLGVLFLAGAFSLWPVSVDQPIEFNHQLHIADVGLVCTDCHLYAETGVRATIPNIGLCGDCHAEAQTKSPEEARLVEYVQSEEPVPWRKVYSVPDHVYFSHRRHTTLGQIPCTTCHGEMETRESPVTRAEVSMSMDFCMDCHYEMDTSNDCLLCHR